MGLECGGLERGAVWARGVVGAAPRRGGSGVAVGDLESDALDDIKGVDDVAQGLGHLAPMSVAHHGVQVHLLEGHLPCNRTPRPSHTQTERATDRQREGVTDKQREAGKGEIGHCGLTQPLPAEQHRLAQQGAGMADLG